MRRGFTQTAVAVVFALASAGCGNESTPASVPAGPSVPQPLSLTRVSQASPYAAGCNGTAEPGTLFQDAEVEPILVIDPQNAGHWVGAWQQDRWSNGGAQALQAGVSVDGGASWNNVALPFSRCTGGTDDPRTTDPWLSFGSNGVLHAMALSFRGEVFGAGSESAMLVSRSLDGGFSWSAPATLLRDGPEFFNDKNAITADGENVYAVWDRLDPSGRGPTFLARSTDSGASWEAARAVYDPGPRNQTINNQVVALADGSVVLFFSQLDTAEDGAVSASLRVLRSVDDGANWSAPVKIADIFAVGAADPETGEPVRDGANLGTIAAGPGSRVTVSWQDARPSNGARDAVLFSLSNDGGLTWTLPARINGDTTVPAFTPTLTVAADGTIGVSYCDFRYNNSNPATLPTACWLATSDDAQNWTEQRVAGPFDLKLAPNANGLFLGDYQGLAAVGTDFAVFLVHTNSSTANRTDVYAQRVSAQTPAPVAKLQFKAAPVSAQLSPQLVARSSENLRRYLRKHQPPRSAAKKKR